MIKALSEQLRTSVYKACDMVHEMSVVPNNQYSPVVKRNLTLTDQGKSVHLIYYQATLQKDGTLKLNPPDVAFDKRIYRAFGCDRFLEVLIGTSIDKDIVSMFLTRPLLLLGRTYRLLWSKKGNKPQPYM
jgi:hypothetical protein